jgi:signal transduction histidine kinase
MIPPIEGSLRTFRDRPNGFVSPESGPSVPTLRGLLFALCASLLALLLTSGIMAVHFLRDMHGQETSVREALTERTQMLFGLWTSVQGYRRAVEQFVSGIQSNGDQGTRERLDQLTLQVDTELQRYPSQQDPEESALVRSMEGLFLQQRSVYIAVRANGPAKASAAGTTVGAHQSPMDELTVSWLAKLSAWNGERLRHADRRLIAQFTDLQTGLTRTLAIAFASGLLLASAGTAYILRLERQTRARYTELVQSRQDLQELSARLVDAQESERRAISRELHDEVGQSLGALLVDIGCLSALSGNADPATRNQLEHMRSVAERAFQAVRNIALLLRPSMLDDLGLAAAVEWLGREVSRNSEIEVTVQLENVPEDLPDSYKVCIYRMVQAALHNAVRHSGARNASVMMDRRNGSIRVQVTDDGRGFDPGRTRGLGLLGMEERVKRLSGRLRVESQPGKGTTITAELPSPPAAGG